MACPPSSFLPFPLPSSPYLSHATHTHGQHEKLSKLKVCAFNGMNTAYTGSMERRQKRHRVEKCAASPQLLLALERLVLVLSAHAHAAVASCDAYCV